jgi:hypothetical protein
LSRWPAFFTGGDIHEEVGEDSGDICEGNLFLEGPESSTTNSSQLLTLSFTSNKQTKILLGLLG